MKGAVVRPKLVEFGSAQPIVQLVGVELVAKFVFRVASDLEVGTHLLQLAFHSTVKTEGVGFDGLCWGY